MSSALVGRRNELARLTAVLDRAAAVPAVVATTDATRRLHDGDVITVDGNAGTVELAPPAISPR